MKKRFFKVVVAVLVLLPLNLQALQVHQKAEKQKVSNSLRTASN